MDQDVSVRKEVIVFQNAEAQRVGTVIQELRQRHGLSLTDFARVAKITEDYLVRLEEGNESKVEKAILENIKKAGRVFERSERLS